MINLVYNIPEHHIEAGYDEKEKEPEPERDVDLVIDHIDGKNTEPIKPE